MLSDPSSSMGSTIAGVTGGSRATSPTSGYTGSPAAAASHGAWQDPNAWVGPLTLLAATIGSFDPKNKNRMDPFSMLMINQLLNGFNKGGAKTTTDSTEDARMYSKQPPAYAPAPIVMPQSVYMPAPAEAPNSGRLDQLLDLMRRGQKNYNAMNGQSGLAPASTSSGWRPQGMSSEFPYP